MKTYDEFHLNKCTIRRLMLNKATKKINSFIKKYGIEPKDIDLYYKLTDDEKEYYRRIHYSIYLSNSKCPENITDDTPMIKPVFDEWIIATLNITTTSEPTVLISQWYTCYPIRNIGTVMVDDKEIEIDSDIKLEYTFDTLGTHVIKILPKDTSIIPKCIFYDNINLRRVIIPSSVQKIDDMAFYGCVGLKEIYMFPLIAPTFQKYYYRNDNWTPSFYNCKNGTIFYPKGSDYSEYFSTKPYVKYTGEVIEAETLGTNGWDGIEMEN